MADLRAQTATLTQAVTLGDTLAFWTTKQTVYEKPKAAALWPGTLS